MPRLIVSPLSAVDAISREHRPSHLVSLLGPDSDMQRPDGIAPANHLSLVFNDISTPIADLIAPTEAHVDRLIAFLTDWDRGQPMLIHCWAGISRSTAAAYIALCLHRPDDDEAELARLLRRASPTATPNPLMVALGDIALDRDGRMVDAIDTIGRGAEAWEGKVFTLPLA